MRTSMTKHIAEELPTRKHAPAAAAPAAKGGEGEKGEGKDPEKKVRQAVYDIRYRARREDVPLRTAFSQYMSNSNLSANERTAVKAKLFGDGPMKEAKELAADSVANAMIKVFVSEEEQAGKDKKMKVRVEDKNGKSYVRYADRAKITELRANPNIRSVEITSYGEPYEGERKKGERTAAAKAGKDYDGDGKVESPSKEHAGAVHNAIQRKKGGKPDGQDTRRDTNEEFIADAVAEATEKKLDILPKDQVNNVKVHGKKGSNGVQESKEVMKSVVDRFRDKMKEREEQGKEAEEFSKSLCPDCGKFPCECDDRARKTSMDLYKNKLRARGLKMSFEPEGDSVDEATYPSDFRNPDGSKRSVAKRKDGRPQQHDQETDRSGRRKTVDEETEDSLRDKRQERGGVDGNTRYDRAPKAPNTKKFGTGKTAVQKELEKRHGKGASAMDIVKAEMEKKYGKGAVMSTKKKEEEKED